MTERVANKVSESETEKSRAKATLLAGFKIHTGTQVYHDCHLFGLICDTVILAETSCYYFKMESKWYFKIAVYM